MTLAVLPGANTLDTAMSVVAPRLGMGSPGLKVGYCASARIRPVLGCMTTTVQFLALVRATWAAHSCSAFHWMSDWIVSRRSPAGTAALTVDSVPGIGCPFVPFSYTTVPLLPARSESYVCSRPCLPVMTPVL